MKRLSFLILVAAVMLSACATISVPRQDKLLSDSSNLAWPDFSLKLSYEPYYFHIPVYTVKYDAIEDEALGNLSHGTYKSAEDEYHTLCVQLNPFLYLDAEGNIYLSPLNMLGLGASSNFVVEKTLPAILGKAVIPLNVDNDKATTKNENPVAYDMKVEKMNNIITINTGIPIIGLEEKVKQEDENNLLYTNSRSWRECHLSLKDGNTVIRKDTKLAKSVNLIQMVDPKTLKVFNGKNYMTVTLNKNTVNIETFKGQYLTQLITTDSALLVYQNGTLSYTIQVLPEKIVVKNKSNAIVQSFERKN